MKRLLEKKIAGVVPGGAIIIVKSVLKDDIYTQIYIYATIQAHYLFLRDGP